MVRPEFDVTIDYYSLLSVSHRADAEEIKKSYRKLGVPSPSGQLLTCLPCSSPLSSRQELGTRTGDCGKVPVSTNGTRSPL